EKPPEDQASTAPAARGKTETHAAPAAPSVSEAPANQAARISPKARRLAKELGVDIATLRGSGPGGEILASDVQAASPAPSTSSTAAAPQESANVEVPSTLGR